MIHIPERALVRLGAIARTAMPKEAGGILVGWLEGDCVSIVDLVEVPTPRPDRNRYTLNARRANDALGKYLAGNADDRVGYVGSWHTHPAMAPPSSLDLTTFWRATRHLRRPLAFIVAATDGQTTNFHQIQTILRGGWPQLQHQPTITRRGA